MREKQMKGITCCGDCGYYDWKKHRCSRPCKDEGDAQSNFYADCPLPDVAPVVHGEWVLVGTNEHDYETSVEEKCSLCGRYVYRYDTEPQDNYCPTCGCKMDGESEESK